MVISIAYLTCTDKDSFRCNEPAKIMGVKILKPEHLPAMLCYELKYGDGIIYYKPIVPINYKIISRSELVGEGFK